MSSAAVTGRVRYAALAVVSAALLVGGCAAEEPAPEGATAQPEQPSRPVELPVTTMSEEQLCTLLTPEQQAELGIANPTIGSSTGDVRLPGNADYQHCMWGSPPDAEPSFGVIVAAIPQSLDAFTEQLGEPFPETAASYEVAGFRAEQQQAGAGLEGLGCSVFVDVAEGQTLQAWGSPSLTYGLTNQQMCDLAKRVAESAVATLQG
ncbi:DUF3558 domain-containing protein [Saccharopolyspora cebuensis]|uniref:DUF3558 domain-containing protein n=1 Tax=Saccharopolyspora cebuensis TaxID=418759 RepID=A0ABV4CEA3_9PSEU